MVCGFSSIRIDWIRKGDDGGNDDHGGGGETVEYGGEKVGRKDEERKSMMWLWIAKPHE